MISHALTIVANELDKHLADAYGAASSQVRLGSIAEGFTTGNGNNRELLCLSVVNLKEEKTLKNVPTHVRNDTTLRVTYENPPVFLNVLVLLTAPHQNYTNGLVMLSRGIRFFQFCHVFTQDTVAPVSLTTNAPANTLDQLEVFKLILDLYSPTMEEVNHLWGTLGGKQYPFAIYLMRMLDLKFRAVQGESGLITEVVTGFSHK